MRKRGVQSPPGAFSINEIPEKAGFVSVKFYENAHKIQIAIDGGDPVNFWEYDEYEIITPLTPSLTADIEENYNKWLVKAQRHTEGLQ